MVNGWYRAVDLTVMHPDIFSAFVDVAGDVRPNVGGKEQTLARLFGGNQAAWAAYDPLTVMNRHGRYSGVSGWFDVPAPSGPHNLAEAAGQTGATTPDRVANPEGPGRRGLLVVQRRHRQRDQLRGGHPARQT